MDGYRKAPVRDIATCLKVGASCHGAGNMSLSGTQLTQTDTLGCLLGSLKPLHEAVHGMNVC